MILATAIMHGNIAILQAIIISNSWKLFDMLLSTLAGNMNTHSFII
jgi:hypothetical protein